MFKSTEHPDNIIVNSSSLASVADDDRQLSDLKVNEEFKDAVNSFHDAETVPDISRFHLNALNWRDNPVLFLFTEELYHTG